MMQHKRPVAATVALLAALTLTPGMLRAQTADDYAPPKLVKMGTSTTPAVGTGTVVVKVLVQKDGTAVVQNIIRSTNHELDAVALEVAKTSTYRSATRNGQHQVAFYDFTLKFANGSASNGEPAAPTGLAAYEAMWSTKPPNYTGARTGLDAYVAAHPDDQAGLTDLGVTAFFQGDFAASTAAFDKVTNLDPKYKGLAAQAYAQEAVKQTDAKNNQQAIDLAKRAVALDGNFAEYNILGRAQFPVDVPSAIISFERARMLAESSGADPAKRASIDANLVSAYLQNNDPATAKKRAAEATQLNPGDTGAQNAFANYYVEAAQAQAKQQKFAEAGALLEEAAAAEPSQSTGASSGAVLYSDAAIAYLQAKPDPLSAKAQAAAEKALALTPDSALANYAEGIALANQGKKADALVRLNKADALAKASPADSQLTPQIENALKQLNGGASGAK